MKREIKLRKVSEDCGWIYYVAENFDIWEKSDSVIDDLKILLKKQGLSEDLKVLIISIIAKKGKGNGTCEPNATIA